VEIWGAVRHGAPTALTDARGNILRVLIEGPVNHDGDLTTNDIADLLGVLSGELFLGIGNGGENHGRWRKDGHELGLKIVE
jgi:hypothetical protein